MKKYKINYPFLKVMAIGFTRGDDLFGRLIRMVRKAEVNHAFIVTEDHRQLFATEEGAKGLAENSLEKYTTDKNKIVAMYLFSEFKDQIISDAAQCFLSDIRRRAGESSRYDFKGLFSFLPVIGKWFKPDSKKQWCSENCASILKKYGAKFIDKVEIAPDELLAKMKNDSTCIEITTFYC